MDAGELVGVEEGQVLAGKYRVECVLGVGGMGAVVAAHHLQLDEKVALKFMLPAALSNRESVARFEREARAAVKIKSDHVARVLDVGTLENGAPYMVMEFLDGADLGTLLSREGPFPVEQAVDFVLQTCEAIAEAHSLGIVHRDLKPANLFCTRRADGRLHIKVLDFGISKVTRLGNSAADPAMTSAAAVLGSPFYMSPEQVEASYAVDARTDLWSLGVVLFELVTGKVPFRGSHIGEVSLKILGRQPPLLRELRPDAPEGLEAAISRCLEKERESRYRDVAELAVALLPFGGRRSRASVEKIADTIQAAGLAAPTLSVSPLKDPFRPPGAGGTIAPLGRSDWRVPGARGSTVGIVAVVGTLAGVAALGFVVQRGFRATPTATTTTAAVFATTLHGAETVQLPAPAGHPPGESEELVPPSTETTAAASPEKGPPPATSARAVRLPAGHESNAPPTPPATRALAAIATASPHASAAPAVAVKKTECDPNYEIDPKSGAHKFKPWCFPTKEAK